MVDLFRRATGRDHAEPSDSPVLVIGLGRFGSSVAMELEHLGFEVMGVDRDERLVQQHTEALTHVIEADTTDIEVLQQIGAADFDDAVVGIGTDVEASILTTAGLVDMGVDHILAKALTDSHGRILERIGAHNVVYPEFEMGRRAAHLVKGRIIDWFQVDEGFAMVETAVPSEMVGQTLAGLALRAEHEVTVVCVKPAGDTFTYATADTELQHGDVLVVAGPTDAAERFAELG